MSKRISKLISGEQSSYTLNKRSKSQARALLMMIQYRTAVLLCLYHQVLADCGEPGYSKSAPLDSDTFNAAQIYLENTTVTYKCSNALLGSYHRECVNGKWTNTIPKCAMMFNATNLKITHFGGFVCINWTEIAKVVGFQIALRVENDDGDKNSLLSENFHPFSVRLRGPENGIFRALFALNYTDLQSYKPINHLAISWRDENVSRNNDAVDNCLKFGGSNFSYCFENNSIELFYFPESYNDCDLPDAPLSASVIAVPNPNGNGLIAEYTCREGYRLKGSLEGRATCIEQGDWTGTDFEPCEPITCGPIRLNGIGSLFEPTLSMGHFPPGSEAVFKCPRVSFNVTVSCLANGQWTGIPDYCLTSKKSGHSVKIVALIAMALVIVILFIGVLFLYLKKIKTASVACSTNHGVVLRPPVNGYSTAIEPTNDHLYALPDLPDIIVDPYRVFRHE